MHQLSRTKAILFAGILLGGYITLLIGLVYLGQQHLRQSLHEQATLALEKQAAAVGYFLTDQQDEIRELTRSPILNNFFANRALGMSMQYGLRASLLVVRDELERLRQRKQLQGCTVYSRISLVDHDGSVLVSTGPNANDIAPSAYPLDGVSKGVSLHIGKKEQGYRSHIYASIEYNDRTTGLIVAEINLGEALSSLLKQSDTADISNQLMLMGAEGRVLISAGSVDPAIPAAEGENLITAPIIDSRYKLSGVVELDRGQGLLTSPWFLFALSLITLPVLLGVYYLLRLNNKNLLLKARYLSSRQRQKDLHHFRKQLDLSTDLIVVIDPDTSRYLDVNQTMCDFFGLSHEELLQKRVVDLSEKYQSMEQWREFLDQLRKEGRITFEDGGRHVDGRPFFVEINAHYARYGEQDSIVAIYRNISGRKHAETAISQANQRFMAVLEGIDAAVYVADMETYEVLYVNQKVKQLVGDVVGKKCWQTIRTGQSGPCAFCTNKKLLDEYGQPTDNHTWDFQDPVDHRWFHCSDRAIPWDDGRYVHLQLATDITHRIQDEKALTEAHQQLELLAYYDPLTKLANRRLFIDYLGHAFFRADRDEKELAICYLDLDGFKEVNDTLGHELGDNLLRQVSERLLSILRGDDLVARWGGDEFALLINGQDDEKTCASTLDRLIEALASPYELDGRIFHVTASIGVTVYPQDCGDPDTLLRHADQAMYLAKQGGRNRYYFFDPDQDRRVNARREQLKRVAEAIESNELQLFYQPKVDMAQGRVFGVEALVRWQHPEQGLLPPNAFLPLIEGHKLQHKLDWWVLKTAVNQAARWHADGLGLSVSINVSPSTIQYAGFAERLRQLVDDAAINTDLIELEIIESDAIDDLDAVSAVIRQCAAYGVCFALDDYGTGYSSLTYIRRLPVQTLKIDQTFVKDILRDQDDLNIVEGVIGLARAFGREVIAEGVEDTEIGVRLLELGCSWAQGYAIARPMPHAEIATWIKHYSFPTEWLEAAKKLSAA